MLKWALFGHFLGGFIVKKHPFQDFYAPKSLLPYEEGSCEANKPSSIKIQCHLPYPQPISWQLLFAQKWCGQRWFPMVWMTPPPNNTTQFKLFEWFWGGELCRNNMPNQLGWVNFFNFLFELATGSTLCKGSKSFTRDPQVDLDPNQDPPKNLDPGSSDPLDPLKDRYW